MTKPWDSRAFIAMALAGVLLLGFVPMATAEGDPPPAPETDDPSLPDSGPTFDSILLPPGGGGCGGDDGPPAGSFGGDDLGEACKSSSGNVYYGRARGVCAEGNVQVTETNWSFPKGRITATNHTWRCGNYFNNEKFDAMGIRMIVQKKTATGQKTCASWDWKGERNTSAFSRRNSSLQDYCGKNSKVVAYAKFRFRVETADPYVYSDWITNGKWELLD